MLFNFTVQNGPGRQDGRPPTNSQFAGEIL